MTSKTPPSPIYFHGSPSPKFARLSLLYVYHLEVPNKNVHSAANSPTINCPTVFISNVYGWGTGRIPIEGGGCCNKITGPCHFVFPKADTICRYSLKSPVFIPSYKFTKS